MLALITANEVFISINSKGEMYYASESPDDIAFVEAAKALGFHFIKSQHGSILIKIDDHLIEIPVL
jgi:magnesium-transporting ATPase (P-type)